MFYALIIRNLYLWNTPTDDFNTNYVYLPYLTFVGNSIEIDPDHCKYIYDK